MQQTLAHHCACHPDDPICAPLWKADEATDDERLIEGLASIDIRDEQGEIVHPDKLDLSYLLKKGKINWHHGSDPGDQIGVVTSFTVGKIRDVVPAKYHTRLRKYLNNVGLWVRGRIKNGLPKADAVWKDLCNNPIPDDHGLGFSVQGRARRENGHVVGGMVNAIALTHAPVLPETFVTLAKAFARRSYSGSVNQGPYGDQNLGDGLVVNSVIGSRKLRNADGSIRVAPITRSVTMPMAGESIRLPDGIACAMALRGFIDHLRAMGPQRGNILDGTYTYFMMQGLDALSAKALERYVRENSDKIFKKVYLNAPSEMQRAWFDGAPLPQQLQHVRDRETEMTKAFEDADVAKREVPPRPALQILDDPPMAPETALTTTELPAAPRRRPRIIHANWKGQSTMYSTTNYLDQLDKAVATAEASQTFVTPDPRDTFDITPVFGELCSRFGALRKAAACPQPNVAILIKQLFKAVDDLERCVRQNTALTKSFSLASRYIPGPQLLSICATARRCRDVRDLDDFRTLLLDVVSGNTLRKSLSDGVCAVCGCKNSTGSTSCRDCGVDLAMLGAPAAPPKETKADRVKFMKLLHTGQVPCEIAMAYDRKQINAAQACELLKDTPLKKYVSALTKGLIAPDVALRVARNQMTHEEALQGVSVPETVEGRLQSLMRDRKITPQLAMQLDRGQISAQEAIELVEAMAD